MVMLLKDSEVGINFELRSINNLCFNCLTVGKEIQ